MFIKTIIGVGLSVFLLSLITYADIEITDTNSITQSDQDIQLLQHLIEVDAIQLESQNSLYIRETLIFKNTGQKNFSGTLRTWVHDGLNRANVMKVSVMMDAKPEPIESRINVNILSWQDFIKANDPQPNLYIVEYVIPAEMEGALTKSLVYTKKFAYPTLINYKYGGKPGLPSIVLKVTKNKDDSFNITDEKGNSIGAPEDLSEEGNNVIYRWGVLEFEGINIEFPPTSSDSISQSQTEKQIKELQDRLNKTEAKQIQQEKRISWLEEKINLIISWLRSIVGYSLFWIAS